jgi:hypothetical protein
MFYFTLKNYLFAFHTFYIYAVNKQQDDFWHHKKLVSSRGRLSAAGGAETEPKN